MLEQLGLGSLESRDHNHITRKASWETGHWNGLFVEVIAGWWNPQLLVPVPTKISADKHTLNQLPVKKNDLQNMLSPTPLHFFI